MSYSVSIRPPSPPTVAGLAEVAQERGGRLVEPSAPDGPWPRDFHAHFYAPGRSTRGVECSWDGRNLSVRFTNCAAPEDYALGLEMLECVGAEGGEVCGECGIVAPLSRLRDVFDAGWIADRVASDTSALASIVADRGTVTLPGPRRPIHVGARLLRELEPDREGFAERLLEKVRQVQHLDTSALYEASVMQVAAGDELRTFAAWGPEVDYLFPEVQSLLVLEGGKGEPVPVPFAALRELAPEWRWVDEVQVVVPAIPAEAWARLYARAREMRDPAFPPPPAATAPPRRRPWWKFW